MIVLEDSLREVFTAQVEATPPALDRAGTAIRRGRSTRRRRMAAGALATALVLGGLFGGVVSLQGWWSPEPPAERGVLSPILPPPEPDTVTEGGAADRLPWRGPDSGVEVRLVNRVWTADGRRPLLRGSGLVEQAYRTPYGLVYGNSEEIRLLRDDGVVDLARDVGRWLPSPDGERVALVSGGVLQVAALQPDGLGTPARAEVAEDAAPVSFWGERVVLARPDGSYDVWHPDAPYLSDVSDDVVAVYGPAGDDLAVLVGGGDGYCLALVPSDRVGPLLDPTACRRKLPVTGDGYGWLSPDGQYLAVPDGEQVRLLPVDPSSQDPDGVTCPRSEEVTPAWQGPSTLLTADETGVVSCAVNGVTVRLGRPAGVASQWDYVPALGVSPEVASPRIPR